LLFVNWHIGILSAALAKLQPVAIMVSPLQHHLLIRLMVRPVGLVFQVSQRGLCGGLSPAGVCQFGECAGFTRCFDCTPFVGAHFGAMSWTLIGTAVAALALGGVLNAALASLDRLTPEGTFATLRYLRRLSNLGINFKSYTEQYVDSLGVFGEAIIGILAAVA
jgi:hypothetical protein